MNIKQAEFSIEAKSKAVLPLWKGSTIRGAIGESLKRVYCIHPEKKSCYACKNVDVCPYGYFYETKPKRSAEKFSAYYQVTKPFVIEPPLDEKTLYEPGEEIKFKMNFFGKGTKYISEIITALKEIKTIGRFRKRGYGQVQYKKGKVKNISFTEPRDDFKEVSIELKTPTQLVFGNAIVTDISFDKIIKNISRKHSAITYFHENRQENIEWKKVFEDAEKAKVISQSIEYKVIKTYSSRLKKARFQLGFTGTLRFDVSEIKEKKLVHYLLEFGRYSHIGKFATAGQGVYDFMLT